jgi:hypothetical protein
MIIIIIIITITNYSFILFFIYSKNNISKCLLFSPLQCTVNNAWATGHTALGSILISADLSYNDIESIDDLSHHPNLECLMLSHNAITHISGLQNLRLLQVC